MIPRNVGKRGKKGGGAAGCISGTSFVQKQGIGVFNVFKEFGSTGL